MSATLIQPSPQHTRETNPNLAALEQAYAQWSETRGGNVDAILDLFADDVEMRSVLTPETVPHELAGTHFARARAADYFAELTANWQMISYDVDRFIADGDDIVMVGRCHWRHRASGNEVDTPKVDIWHFENGKATSFLEMFDSLAFARAVGAI
jgi:ketosteroid isomerase-like protein